MWAALSDGYENGRRARHVFQTFTDDEFDQAKEYVRDMAAIGYSVGLRKVTDEADARSLEIDPNSTDEWQSTEDAWAKADFERDTA